jgi:hypothetical protein
MGARQCATRLVRQQSILTCGALVSKIEWHILKLASGKELGTYGYRLGRASRTAASCRKGRASRMPGQIWPIILCRLPRSLDWQRTISREIRRTSKNAVPSGIVGQEFHEMPLQQCRARRTLVHGAGADVSRNTNYVGSTNWMLMLGQNRWSRVLKSRRVS